MDVLCYRTQSKGSLCYKLRNYDWLAKDQILLATDYLMSKTGSLLFDMMFNVMRVILEEKVLDCDPVTTPVEHSSSSNHEQDESQNQQPAENSEPQPVVRRSLHKRKEPNRLDDWVQGDELDVTDFDEIDLAVAQPERYHYLLHISQDEPRTIEEAVSSKENEKWQEAADK